MARLIASGDVSDLGRLASYETAFNEGDRGWLDLYLRITPPELMVRVLEKAIRAAGVRLESLEVVEHHLLIHFQKAIPPLAIIVGALAGLFLLMILSFKLFKEEAVEVAIWLTALFLVAIAAFVLVAVKGKAGVGPGGVAIGGAS